MKRLHRFAGVALVAAALVSLGGIVNGASGDPRTPAEHRRGGVQTFRGLPDWTPVQDKADLAGYLAAQQPPSRFPFFSQVAQFWQSYGEITRASPGTSFDLGHHLHVIGTGIAHGFEFGLKACYEATVGQLTEASANGQTAEEQLAARVAQDHAAFIANHRPQEYDHAARLKELWQAVPWWGDDPLRKWERRFALSTEYGAKAAWSWVMNKLDGPAPARPTTAVLLDRWPGVPADVPELKRVQDLGGSVLATVPRRGALTGHANALARQGVRIEEVAGNLGPIVASVMMPRDAAPLGEGQLLFIQPVLSQPGMERRWLTVPVPQLTDALRAWGLRPEVRVDHLYDY